MSETKTMEQKAEEAVKALTDARDALDRAEKNGATKDEVKALREEIVSDIDEKFKGVDEALAEVKKAAASAERKASPAGITQKALDAYNAERQERGEKALTVEEAADQTKAFEAVMNASPKGKAKRFDALTDSQRDIAKALTSGGANSGALLIPPAFASDIEQSIRDMNDFMVHARTIRTSQQTGGNTVQRVLNGTSTSGWTADEITAKTADTSPSSIKQDVSIHNLLSVQEVSMGLMEDAGFSLSEYLTDPVAQDMALTVETTMIGDGSAAGSNRPEPLIVNTAIADTALPAFTASGYLGAFRSVDSGDANGIVQSSTVDVSRTIMSMPSQLQTGYRRNGRWFMNPTVLSTVALLKGTDGHYILRSSQDSNSSNPLNPTLAGYPVSICESFPDIAANANVLCFGSMYRGYTIAMGRGMEMKMDETSQFPATRYLFSQRVGGGPFDPKALLFLKVSA